jgi:hypothetical protein
MVHEVEIKVSWTDFLNEFKKPKHEQYKTSFFSPNYYSFMIPEELLESVSEKLKDSPYGIFIYRNRTNYKPLDNVKKIKPAQALHDRKASNKVKYEILRRMGNEVIQRSSMVYASSK